MGTIRFTTAPDGDQEGLYDHEGYVAQVFDDRTTHGGGNVTEVNQRTVAFQAACDCGWHGPTVVPRQPGQSAWLDWDDLPVLEDEWIAHTDPFLDALERDSRLGGETPAPGLAEITDVLAEIRGLADGTIPESESQRIMARKRRLIDHIEPGFYDTHPATDADDEPSRHRLETEAEALGGGRGRPATEPGTGRIVQAWSLVDGDIHLPAAEADWWGAALSILVAAIHHPQVLADQRPDTDPIAVAREVLDELDTLRHAVELAERAPQRERGGVGVPVVTGRGGDASRVVVISPGAGLRQLVWLLDAFAHAVIEPGSHTAACESASGHVASAWSRDLGVAAGAIQ